MSRAPSDSLDEKSWEGNLETLIFQTISVIPGIFLSRLVVCYASGASPGAPGGMELGPRRSQEVRESPELQNGGLRPLLLDGRVLDTSGASRRKSPQGSSRALRPPFWSCELPPTS